MAAATSTITSKTTRRNPPQQHREQRCEPHQQHQQQRAAAAGARVACSSAAAVAASDDQWELQQLTWFSNAGEEPSSISVLICFSKQIRIGSVGTSLAFARFTSKLEVISSKEYSAFVCVCHWYGELESCHSSLKYTSVTSRSLTLGHANIKFTESCSVGPLQCLIYTIIVLLSLLFPGPLLYQTF